MLSKLGKKVKKAKKVYGGEFVDAQAQHAATPKTFEVPSNEELSALKAGDVVKVCENAERFWVIVQTVVGNHIIGEVNNNLVHDHEFECGDLISFERRHIFSISERDG